MQTRGLLMMFYLLQIFYAGPKEMPPHAIKWMHERFKNLKFIDIYSYKVRLDFIASISSGVVCKI